MFGTKSLNHSVRMMIAVLVTGAAMAMTGCLTSSDKGGGGGSQFNFSMNGTVLLHTPPQGGSPGILVTQSTEYACWDDEEELFSGAARQETITDTAEYAIVDGVLHLWSKDECFAETFAGTSATVLGTWTSSTFAVSKIPVAYRSEDCIAYYAACEQFEFCDDDVELEIGEIFENFNASITVTATGTTSSFTGNYCSAQDWGGNFADPTSGIEGVELVSSSCSEVKVRNTTTNKVATWSSSLNGSMATMTFNYDGSTCTLSEQFGPVTAGTQCSIFDDAKALDDFFDCYDASGFLDDLQFPEEDWLAKKSRTQDRSTLDILRGGMSRGLPGF